MEKKTISINPKLFETNKGGKGNKSEKKKPKGILKPNTLKRQLMQKIKNHKKEKSGKHEETGNRKTNEGGTEDTKKIENDESEFDIAMKDLKKIVSTAKDNNKTLKRSKIPTTGVPPLLQMKDHNLPQNITTAAPVINIKLPDSLDEKKTNMTHNTKEPLVRAESTSIKNAPPYGCLKGGTKPTYKTWKNTNRPSSVAAPNKISIVDTEPMSADKGVGSFTYREKRLQEIKNKMKAREEHKLKTTPYKAPKKLKRTIKNTYTLGKNGKSIKVLIKNSKTRKNNQIDKNIIEQTELKDMKLYLKNHGLISAGSSAPMDVMKEIFVSSRLSGDVENKNPDVLVDNYLSKDF